MELRQLQAMITLINSDFSVSRTAEQLYLVQSAVSQQLKKLELELGSQLFIRKGKRLIGLTDFGKKVEKQARKTLNSAKNINLLSEDNLSAGKGVLRIGCTHTQARYILPTVIRAFHHLFPDIELQIHQGNPKQLVAWAGNDEVDFSICTEELAESGKLQSIPCYQWNRSLITLPGHELHDLQNLTLDDLTRYPIITYILGFTGRQHFNDIFTKAGLTPNTILSAADTDIIKAYVLEGLGIGVIADMAFDPEIDTGLQKRDLNSLFPWETTRIAYLKDKYIRRSQQRFIDLFLEAIQMDKTGRFKVVSD